MFNHFHHTQIQIEGIGYGKEIGIFYLPKNACSGQLFV